MAVEDSFTSQLGVAQLGFFQLGMVSSEPAPTPAMIPLDWYVPLSTAAPAKIEVVSY